MSIEKTYQMGEDALQNLWQLNFGSLPLPNIDVLNGAFLLRVQTITIPTSGSQTYEVNYKTSTIERISGKGETPKEFTFDFRVDAYWSVYKALTIWKNSIFGTWDNKIGPDYRNSADRTNYRMDVTVQPCDREGNILSTTQLAGIANAWIFKGCFPKTIGDVPLDYSGGDPLVISVTMGMLGMKDFLA